eukprot:CAMPEP_0184495926 /NCGR_PEP_ID=MMETSP0113_2-20130426/32702_1 /TAXON_ID=91329 /ORGANISM="Norrisiella sphaerica, Strain BC52" /LENGTH=448 /DNA_ID=CAMNT_0026882347 /DNA_START=12 /DNA_END=1358 /DNA_ORIENTATION=+
MGGPRDVQDLDLEASLLLQFLGNSRLGEKQKDQAARKRVEKEEREAFEAPIPEKKSESEMDMSDRSEEAVSEISLLSSTYRGQLPQLETTFEEPTSKREAVAAESKLQWRKRKGRSQNGACRRCYIKKLKCTGKSLESRYPCERCISDGLAACCGDHYATETWENGVISLPVTRLQDVIGALSDCKDLLCRDGSEIERSQAEALALIKRAEALLQDASQSARSKRHSANTKSGASLKRERNSLKKKKLYSRDGKDDDKAINSKFGGRYPHRQSNNILPKKKFVKRASRACIRCRSRKVRCNQDTKAQFPCQRCIADGFSAECVAHVALPSREQRKVLGDLIARDPAAPKALADHRNRHQGIQCPRNELCQRPAKHPGHCRLHNMRRSRSIGQRYFRQKSGEDMMGHEIDAADSPTDFAHVADDSMGTSSSSSDPITNSPIAHRSVSLY